MPTPEEMLALSEAGKQEVQERTRAEKRAEAAKLKAKRESIMARKDGIIRSVESMMAEVARKHGSTQLRWKVFEVDRWSERKLYEPLIDAVVEHFTQQGYKADYKVEGQTEYYGDGAGPGADWYYVNVDWTPDA